MSSPSSPPDPSVTAAPEGVAAVRGTRLLGGRYRLDALLASGGMAQVWQATDEVLQRQVAVKLLHPHLATDQSFVARFRLEAVAAARLAHPGIVSIYDTCSAGDGTEAIVMELVPGRTLRQRLDEPTPIDPWQAAGLAAQVAEALEAAHRAGLVHRDIKPANILLCGDGRVKVADFGIAKALAEADLTQEGLMVGTAKYVAPEQVEGHPVDARTDLYSLGVVLYEMLCGRVPFKEETDAATALARLHRDPLRPRQVRPGVPKPLEEVVLRAMARDPAQRYESAADLRAGLLAAGGAVLPEPDLTTTGSVTSVPPAPPPPLASPGQSAPPSAPIPPPPQPEPTGPSFVQSERDWLVPTVLVVVVAVALGIAGVLLGRSGAGDLIGSIGDKLTKTPEPTAIAITGASDFDPDGDHRENPKQAPLIHDGQTSTAWTTENYKDRDITKLKAGVGIVLTAERAAELSNLTLTSNTNDWSASFYVADQDPGTLAGWGEPVVTLDGIKAGTPKVDLGRHKGKVVLIWITDRGDGTGSDGRVRLQEAALQGVPT